MKFYKLVLKMEIFVLVTSQTNDTSDQVRRSPVPIYKGPEPWRPLSNAVAFGVKRVGAEDEGQERLNAAPNGKGQIMILIANRS